MAQLSLALIAAVIGIALVAQFRSQARPAELSSLPVAELSTRIQTLSDATRQLRAALADQTDLLAEYQTAVAQGSSALDVNARSCAGFAPSGLGRRGPGTWSTSPARWTRLP
jgi:hypothetical protein